MVYGTYTVTVTDQNGCSFSTTASVGQSTTLGSSITSQTNVLCYGNNTATATVTATNGTTPYTYSWNTSPIQTTQTATGLTAGTYTVTVKDHNGCISPSNATITQPTAALSASTTPVNVLCYGNNTGSATANATGGTGAYTYSWNTAPVQTTQTATGLTAGTYKIGRAHV